MKKTRGFTYIEVILSLFIFGVISLFILPTLSQSIIQTKKTKNLIKLQMNLDSIEDKIRSNALTRKDVNSGIKLYDNIECDIIEKHISSNRYLVKLNLKFKENKNDKKIFSKEFIIFKKK